ncbi:MAG: iron ABC transporter permease [Lachnospiraceae bacterium]|nr:iron ABC transporter permease [Lachnospiraceae bacterium]
MSKIHLKNKAVTIIALFVLLFICFVLCLSLGSVRISPKEIFKAIIYGGDRFASDSLPLKTVIIVRSIRLPRVVGGLLAGVGLSVAGVLLQGVMNNVLAGPNTIGVGSGAGFCVMLSMLMLPGVTWAIPVFAFAGALIATLLIFALAYFSNTSRVTIILAGITVSSFLSAGINLIKTLNTDIIININSFLMGNLSGVTFGSVWLPGIGITVGLMLAILFSKHLNMLGLGEGVATSLGMRVSAVRFILLVIASVLAGCVVSYAGLLSFAGLIVPHICRRFFGNDARFLIPCSALLGGSFVIMCDLLSRILFSPYELPTGIIMSFIGGPFFIYLLIRKKGGRRIHA